MNYELIVLAFVLGIKHGIEPDHLAIINSIKIHQKNQTTGKSWHGLFFSLGHGLTVIAIGLCIAFLSNVLKPANNVLSIIEWIPALLLTTLGVSGLIRVFKNKTSHHSERLIGRIIPKANFTVLKSFIIGVVFALVFDTFSQTSAWLLIVSKEKQSMIAIFTGITFTLGMVVADTSNGWMVSKMLLSHDINSKFIQLLTWGVALSNLILGGMQLLDKMGHALFAEEIIKITLGVGLLFIVTLPLVIHKIQRVKKIHEQDI